MMAGTCSARVRTLLSRGRGCGGRRCSRAAAPARRGADAACRPRGRGGRTRRSSPGCRRGGGAEAEVEAADGQEQSARVQHETGFEADRKEHGGHARGADKEAEGSAGAASVLERRVAGPEVEEQPEDEEQGGVLNEAGEGGHGTFKKNRRWRSVLRAVGLVGGSPASLPRRLR